MMLVVQDLLAVVGDRAARDDRNARVDARAPSRSTCSTPSDAFVRSTSSDREDVADRARAQVHEQVEAAGRVVDAVPMRGLAGSCPRTTGRKSMAPSDRARHGAHDARADERRDARAIEQSLVESRAAPRGCSSVLEHLVAASRSRASSSRTRAASRSCSRAPRRRSRSRSRARLGRALPRPFKPGVPACGGPLDTVSRYRFSPRGWRPAGFTKSVSCTVPTCTGVALTRQQRRHDAVDSDRH